jgi:CrcB protein
MKQLILVGLGGGLGAIARWKLGGLVLHRTEAWKFPLSTFLVNVIGCIVAGLLAGLAIKRDWLTPDARLFLLTGLLGGFTTFSAFGLETVLLLRRGDFGVAVGYVFLSVLAGVVGLSFALSVVPSAPSN